MPILRLRAAAALLVGPFLAQGCDFGDNKPVPALAEVLQLFASPPLVAPGETALITYRVQGAVTVEIRYLSGRALVPPTDVLEGQARTVPLTESTSFILTATNRAHAITRRAITVEVAAPEGARIVRFAPSPHTVGPGQPSTLSWEVENAPGGVELSAEGEVLHTDPQATGSFEVVPAVTTQYRLRAINPKGDAVAMATVTVDARAPRIEAFSATPSLLGAGGTTELAWRVSAADSLRIRRGETELLSTTSSSGTLLAQVHTSTTFFLDALNPNGAALAQVVVMVQDGPTIATFAVTPPRFSGSSTVTVSWSVSQVNELELFANGVPVPSFPAVMTGTVTVSSAGSLDLFVQQTTRFDLVARSAAGEVLASALVGKLVPEIEPNNNPAQAMSLAGDGGGIFGFADIDFFSVAVPAGGRVLAETGARVGACISDTVLELRGPDGTTVLAMNDDINSPDNRCSRIDGRTDLGARDLPAGSYYLRDVSLVQDSPPYALTVLISPPACGNGLLESNAGEGCDDGNSLDGDGCSAACTPE